MSVFQPVTFEWKGAEYTIPADRMLPVIADVETKITLSELAEAVNDGRKVPLATLAQVYGMVLRHAGAAVSDDECYMAMFGEGVDRQRAVAAIGTLMLMMMPPGVAERVRAAQDGAGGKVQKKTVASSNRRSRRSAAAVKPRSSRKSSGA